MKARVIKTDKDYQEALKRIEELMELKDTPDTAEEIELLAVLVGLYEEKKFPTLMPTPLEAIRFRMEQQGLKQKDLVPLIGSKSKVSEVLAGKRPLSLNMIRNLNEELGISLEVLLQKAETVYQNKSSFAQVAEDATPYRGKAEK